MIIAKDKNLFFYTRYNESKHRNDIEIDFLLSNESKTKFRITPMEVKSSQNYSAISLGRFSEIYAKRIGESYIIHPKNLSDSDEIIRIPPYMFLPRFDRKPKPKEDYGMNANEFFWTGSLTGTG